MEQLLLEAVRHILVPKDGGLYVSYTFGHGDSAELFLTSIPQQARLKSFVSDPSVVRAGGTAQDTGLRLEVIHGPVVVSEPVAGVLVNLAPSQRGSFYRMGTDDMPLDLRINPEVGVAATEWLQNTSQTQLASVLDSYASLHDPVLAERLAEVFMQHQRMHGPYMTARQLEATFEDVRLDFEDDHPHLRFEQILRAIGVAVNHHGDQLYEVLEAVFQNLECFGRCAIVTFNPWELSSLRCFLHDSEVPSAQVAACMGPDQMARLYPVLVRGKGYAVRRVSKPLQPGTDDLPCDGQGRIGMIHVLEKVPLQVPMLDIRSVVLESYGAPDAEANLVTQPPSPPFGVANGIVASNASDHQAEWSTSALSELETLSHDIAERKQYLSSMGYTVGQQKKDSQVVQLTRQLNAIHATGPNCSEKRQERCRNRCHVSVLLHEAIEQTTALGPDELYVDCTFGRGGHSQLILSRISKHGRLKAFDVDPLAVQVGRKMQEADQRFEIFHRPFSELSSAVHDSIGGVLLDLGVSSPQLDDPSRGFSVKGKKDGPLDLRMNQEVGVPASEWLQTVTVGQLAWVINSTCYRLEAPLPERIAAVVLERQRQQGPYTSTHQLVKVLEDFGNELKDEHPNLNLAHLVFVALRVFLNREMDQLDLVLEGAFQRLKPLGRCVIICFNRWEMASVRNFIRRHEKPRSHIMSSLSSHRLAQLYPILSSGKDFFLRQAARPVRPSEEELKRNPRSKSIMFVLEKVPMH